MSTFPDAPFSALATAHCPAHDAMPIAVEREFRAVDRWAVHAAERGAQVAADVGGDPGQEPAVGTGDMCAHQLAFADLTGVAEAWRSAGDRLRAQRASGLRLLLPLEDTLRERVQREIAVRGPA